jgi:hypothetical protein
MRHRTMAEGACTVKSPMQKKIALADHIVFRELPFCGVLLDTRSFCIYRLSRRATGALRTALYGPLAVSPYESLLKDGGAGVTSQLTEQVVQMLQSRGMVRVLDEQQQQLDGIHAGMAHGGQ